MEGKVAAHMINPASRETSPATFDTPTLFHLNICIKVCGLSVTLHSVVYDWKMTKTLKRLAICYFKVLYHVLPLRFGVSCTKK